MRVERILVCGSRDWTDREAIKDFLSQFSKDSVVIDGWARGADSLAYYVGKSLGMGSERYPAQWDIYGRSAGPIRNQQMLTEGKPTVAGAFRLNMSRGTTDMIERLEKAGIPVTIVDR